MPALPACIASEVFVKTASVDGGGLAQNTGSRKEYQNDQSMRQDTASAAKCAYLRQAFTPLKLRDKRERGGARSMNIEREVPRAEIARKNKTLHAQSR